MIEAIVIGRVGVDLTPATPRTTLAAADAFVRAVGGFAGNIGTGLARLGIRTAVVSAVGDDGHGDHVRSFLSGEGIDVGPIVDHARLADAGRVLRGLAAGPLPGHLLPAGARGRDTPDLRRHAGRAARHGPRGDRLGDAAGRGAGPVHDPPDPRRATGHARSDEPCRRTILDLDWRPSLWVDPGEAPGLTAQAAGLSDVLIGSDDEFAATGLVPVVAPGGGPTSIVLKHGPAGVSLIDEAGPRHLPGIAVEVLCGIGAGDALTAAFAAGLVRGMPALEAVERGNVAGAIVASRLMCSTAMPTPAEIDALLVRSATA